MKTVKWKKSDITSEMVTVHRVCVYNTINTKKNYNENIVISKNFILPKKF